MNTQAVIGVSSRNVIKVTAADPGVWSWMFPSPPSLCPLPCLFSKCWKRGVLLPTHHEGSPLCLPSSQILFDLQMHLMRYTCTHLGLSCFTSSGFLVFHCEMGFFTLGISYSLDSIGCAQPHSVLASCLDAVSASICLFILSELPHWMKCSSHRQLVTVSLDLLI